MSEAIELEQWWADIADELGGQAAYLHVHGMDWRGRTDGNEVVARAVATIARLTAEIATFQAMMLDCEAERDALAADLAALRGRVEEAVRLHTRMERGDGCRYCDYNDDMGGNGWPCPTVAILAPTEADE